MENYIILNKNSSSGNLFLSKKVFYTLGINSLNSVRAVISKTNKKGIDLNNSVIVSIKNNSVKYRFNVTIRKDVDENSIKNSIVDIITTNLLIYCEIVPFDIDIKVKKA